MMIVENRLKELGISLPEAPNAEGSYTTAVITDGQLYLSGTGGADIKKIPAYGKLGEDVSIEQGYAAARGAALSYLSTMKAVLGDLDRVEKVVKLLCFINSSSDFTRHPEVANGASDLFLEVLGGEKGSHARSAVGVCSLPFNIPVEIEMIVKVSV